MPARDTPVPLRHQLPVYSAALFSNSLTVLVPIMVPLWLVALGASPFEIGIVVGARYAGPLLFSIHGGAMMDRIGLDVVRDIEQVYFEESGEQRDAPPRVLEEKIARGELGVKTGRGFYTYPQPAWMKPGFLKGDGQG